MSNFFSKPYKIKDFSLLYLKYRNSKRILPLSWAYAILKFLRNVLKLLKGHGSISEYIKRKHMYLKTKYRYTLFIQHFITFTKYICSFSLHARSSSRPSASKLASKTRRFSIFSSSIVCCGWTL